MKTLILACMAIYMMNHSVDACVKIVGEKYTVDKYGSSKLKSNKECWDKFEDDKIVLCEY